MTQTANPVAIEVLTDGLVIDGIARRKGETVRTDEATAEALRRHASVKPRPLLRAERDNLVIGNRVCAKGETAYAPSLAIALEHHRNRSATVLNADELGIQLPPRKGDRPFGAPELVKLRARLDIFLTPQNQNVRKGEECEVPREQGETIVKQGHADPVGWEPRPPKRVIVKAMHTGFVAGRTMHAGEVASILQAEAEEPGADRTIVRLGSAPVRVRALKSDCFLGDRAIDFGQVAEVTASIAEDLITEGLAELADGPVSARSPKKAKTA